MTDAPPKQLLRELGQIYVTLASARAYHSAVGDAQDEEARRELTELLVSRGRVQSDDGSRIEVRARSRTVDADVNATLVREGPLLVVVHVSTRVGLAHTNRDRRRIVGANRGGKA